VAAFHAANRDHDFPNFAQLVDYVDHLKRAVYRCLRQKLNLPAQGFFGKGQSTLTNQQSDATLDAMTSRFIAVLYLLGRYSALLDEVGSAAAQRLASYEETPDYKSRLQEYIQNYKLGSPTYTVVSTTGPEHNKVYRIRVAASKARSEGEGPTKKAAGQAAA
jgi:ribonuclease-3